MANLLLCNTIFDRDNDNVLLFNNKEELKEYHNNLKDKVEINNINFDVRNLLSTEIHVIIPNTLSFLQLLNYNYVVVQQDNYDNLYYFIEESAQDAGNQIRLKLSLDVINTYLYDIVGNNTTQALINRTHLDRFIQLGISNQWRYNFDATSPLFERETIKDVAKRVTRKEQLKIAVDTTNNGLNSNFNNFIFNNVACWLYVFLSGNVEYNYYLEDGTAPISKKISTMYYDFTGTGKNDIDGNFVVLAVPIMKENATIKINGTANRNWNTTALDYFLSQNNNYANVQSMKLSIMPPFNPQEINSNDYTIEETQDDGLTMTILSSASILNDSTIISGSSTTTSAELIALKRQDLTKYFSLYRDNTQFRNVFYEDEINNTTEPKLYNEDYATYKLFIGGQQFDLPMSKTSYKPRFKLREIISPDITKASICFDTSSIDYNDNVFSENTETDFTGFNATLDLSLWYPSEDLQNYLASNKNYLQIFNNQQTSEQITNVLSGITRITTGVVMGGITAGPVGALIGGVGAGISNVNNLGGTLVKQSIERANMELTLDNMANSPATTSNINSDALLIQQVSGLGIFLEILQPLPFEQELIIDNFKLFGYTYNRIGIIDDFIKTRRYYNYIEAIIYEINAKMSEQAKDRLKEIFVKGVRFWHADKLDLDNLQINFNLNNIERSILNNE